MHSLHYVISYRASFKPELPEFFISRYSRPGDTVLDPFAGRGTTALQANLMGRVAISADVNPLSKRIIHPKTNPVTFEEIDKPYGCLSQRVIDTTCDADIQAL